MTGVHSKFCSYILTGAKKSQNHRKKNKYQKCTIWTFILTVIIWSTFYETVSGWVFLWLKIAQSNDELGTGMVS